MGVTSDDLLLSDSRWREVRLDAEVRRHLEPGARAFQRDVHDGHLSAFVAHHPKTGWHVSVSHRRNLVGPDGKHPPGRLPTWEELRDARYRFTPNEVTMAIILPPVEEYVNVHPTVMHLYQVPGDRR